VETRIENFWRLITRKKTALLTVALWTLTLSLVIIKSYWLAYLETNPLGINRLSYYQIPYASYEGPSPRVLDLLIIAVASLVVGLVLSDVKEVVYGYIASVSLSLVVGVAFVSFYIWVVLDLGALLSLAPYEWEWVLFMAFWNVFRIMFPWLVAVSLLGVVAGSFLKGWVA